MEQDGNLNTLGKLDAPIIVITDSPGKHVYETGGVMSASQMKLLQRVAKESAIPGAEFRIITPCPNIPDEISTSERKIGEFLAGYRQEMLDALAESTNPKLIITFGKVALRQLMGKQVKMMEARGSLTTCDATPGVAVLPLLSPAHVLRRPENFPIFQGDFLQVGTLRDEDWDVSVFGTLTDSAEYEWVTDLSHLIKNRPKLFTLDAETRGLEWRNGRKAILCVQITTRPGHAYVVPLDKEYFNDPKLRGNSTRHLPKLTDAMIEKLVSQLKDLCGDHSIRIAGHNLKFDIHHLLNYGVEISNWAIDTMQLAFSVDDNMQIKSLDECVRRWVPEYAGYADLFNEETDKANMHLVPHDKMLRYAGGDTDATFRLAMALTAISKEDARQFNCFNRVQMPALQTFVEMERAGIMMDKQALRELGTLFKKTEIELYGELTKMAIKKAPEICRKYAESKDGLKFTPAFLIELLFGEHGFKLKPRVWTDGTRRLPIDQRIPSTSANDHLPYFEHVPFVSKLIEYKKLQKMRTGYVGMEGGFTYKPIVRLKNGKLPVAAERIINERKDDEFKYLLEPVKDVPVAPVAKSVPVRRRSINTPSTIEAKEKAKQDPNQPRFSDFEPLKVISDKLTLDEDGKLWKTTAVEPSGFWQHLIGSDIMHPFFRLDNTVTGRSSSNLQNIPKRDPVMAKAFRKCFKARPGNVLIECDLSQAELRIMAWAANEKNMLRIYREGGDIHKATAAGIKGCSPDEVTKMDRQGAKAVNFGLIYLMWWTALQATAKKSYGVNMSAAVAEASYKGFFAMYPGVAAYQKSTVEFVKKHAYVRALHGALRRLPSINSDDEGIRKECERQSVNSPIQRFGSDIGLMGLARFARDCPMDKMWPVAFIHDAAVLECKEEHAEEALSAIRFYMQSVPFQDWFDITPPIPITADASLGYNLAEMVEREDVQAVAPSWYRADLDAI